MNPIAFSFQNITVHWYGILIALALAISFFLFQKRLKVYGIASDYVYNFFTISFVGGVIGARFWHVFTHWNYYSIYRNEIWHIWEGGVAIHGAIFGGFLFFLIYILFISSREFRLLAGGAKCLETSPLLLPRFVKKTRTKNRLTLFLLTADIVAPLLALSQAIGRIGNFLNQELYGLPSSLPWAIYIAPDNRLVGYTSYEYFHPIFFYEALWLLFVFFVLNIVRKKIDRLEFANNRSSLGYLFVVYVLLWSVGRFFVSFLRIDPMPFYLSLRFDQWTSVFLVFLSIYLLFRCYLRLSKNPR